MAYADFTGFSGYSSPSRQPTKTASTFDAGAFTLNLPDIGTETAQSNLAAAPYNVQLADIINATNRAAQEAANKARLGPAGEQVQSNILGNLQRTSAGLLDPQTEAMLQSGIAQQYGGRGFGVDSPALASAYRRALGQTIEQTEAGAAKQYEDLLAANPAAPLYNMGETVITPQTYLSGRESEARLAEQARENALANQLEYNRLAQQQAQFEAEQRLREQEQAFREAQYYTKYAGSQGPSDWEKQYTPFVPQSMGFGAGWTTPGTRLTPNYPRVTYG